MSVRGALRRRAMRPVTVALFVWAAAGLATGLPSAVPVAIGAGVLALMGACLVPRFGSPVLAVLVVACACASASASTVALTEPTRAQIAELRADGGRVLEVLGTMTGKPHRTATGDVWFDVLVSDVSAGQTNVRGSIPARIGVGADDVGAIDDAAIGSAIRVRGRALPPSSGERALLVVRTSEIDAVATPDGVWAWFEGLRAGLLASVHGLPGPGAGLVPGLAVGDTSMLDPATEQAMTDASLSHLTAVSGSNCAIVVGAVFALLAAAGAPRTLRVAGAAVALCGFVALVSPEPSVVRAAVMAGVAMLAVCLGRAAVGIAVLATAVTVLLIGDPWLSRSLGFALSAAATAALLLLARPLASGLERWMPRPLALAVAVPTAAQLACGPLIVLIDPHVPLLGVLANMVADPAAGPATILGVLACLAPIPWVRDGLSALAWLPASWIAAVAHAATSSSLQNLPWLDGLVGAGLLALVGMATVLLIVRPRGRRAIPALVASAAIVALAAGVNLGHVALRTTAGSLTVPSAWQIAMCDVGQGDATLWRSDGVIALVDTGPDPESLAACLERFGIERIELLVLTHFDLDHVGGATALIGRVGTVLHGPVGEPADTRLLDRLGGGGAEVTLAHPGDTGTLGSTRWQAWGPLPGTEPGNDASVALDVAGPGFPRTVLLGDLGEEPQAALARRIDVPHASIVKVSHHGSADQDASLYRRLHPDVALIGVGGGNRYGHPKASILELLRGMGTTVGRTDTDGALAVWAADDGTLSLWRDRPPTDGSSGVPPPR